MHQPVGNRPVGNWRKYLLRKHLESTRPDSGEFAWTEYELYWVFIHN